ncbi:hypothetical protein BCR44DRAFT_59154 [Catenaria anguillulae PL171]|uniref:Uncharacterized protein n=1 Tax=Catenaria anguillulae PL171 TaxID=765915 RepID=A0A1Y2HDD8_9FUNG|nr:hypothetical protein BCR44DRAFT_59154 [Catenaria anguillulae PL171]
MSANRSTRNSATSRSSSGAMPTPATGSANAHWHPSAPRRPTALHHPGAAAAPAPTSRLTAAAAEREPSARQEDDGERAKIALHIPDPAALKLDNRHTALAQYSSSNPASAAPPASNPHLLPNQTRRRAGDEVTPRARPLHA